MSIRALLPVGADSAVRLRTHRAHTLCAYAQSYSLYCLYMPPLHAAVTRWEDFLSPTPATLDVLRRSPPWSCALAPCGQRWEAVVIAPLQRGLVALDTLGLDPTAGYAVTADYGAHELIVQVQRGTGSHCAGLPGVRVLGHGHTVLLPVTGAGSMRAARLGPLTDRRVHLDGDRLREALTTADRERATCPH
jgi:hypothetical protein